jgi:hypothetical protein
MRQLRRVQSSGTRKHTNSRSWQKRYRSAKPGLRLARRHAAARAYGTDMQYLFHLG